MPFSFGALLRDYMDRGAGRNPPVRWSGPELAKKLNVDPRTVRYWRSESVEPSEENFCDLVHVFLGSTPDSVRLAALNEARNALRDKLRGRVEAAAEQAISSSDIRLPGLCTLPGRVRDFEGREKELDQLCKLLTGGERKATISAAVAGMGGVGKTALALEAAWRIAGQFRDGVLFINLFGSELPSRSRQSR